MRVSVTPGTIDVEPISLVFPDDMPNERIAEFIQILSEIYGEHLEIHKEKAPPKGRANTAAHLGYNHTWVEAVRRHLSHHKAAAGTSDK